jgi:hypothetical protein
MGKGGGGFIAALIGSMIGTVIGLMYIGWRVKSKPEKETKPENDDTPDSL